MAKNIKAIRIYVDINYDITCKKLSDADVVKLAQKYILAMSIETPRIAESTAKELGLTF
jgi:hypothetical protein